MCGIYGSLERARDARLNENLLIAMARSLVHRGPDDEGRYMDHRIALGMRRLSIIDLEGGHQPIANEDQTVWVVCNGEIYNFKELRAELARRGHKFSSHSDTEVIVHLYEDEGVGLFKRLRGMFAIAIWDKPRQRLVLARDRLGKKPLYVARQPGRILFASELKAILDVSERPREINHEALREYLALGYVPAPHTLLQGIEKLMPGHYMTIDAEGIECRPYWQIPTGGGSDFSEQEWIDRTREKLFEAVRIRLVSDVPLGAFLSGGIDSSAIVAAMARMTDQPVKTYSIGFEGPDRYYNELPFARLVADAFATEHHEIIVRPEVARLLPKLIWHLDEPIADSAFVTTYLVSELAAKSVKVILSGVGGDELFGGYRRYLGENLLRYYRWLPKTVREKWLPGFVAAMPKDRNSSFKNQLRYADAFLKSAELDPAARYLSYVTLFSAQGQSAMLVDGLANGGSGASPVMEKLFAGQSGSMALNQIINVDLQSSLPDDLLALTDRMTMAASIECRAPFVDHELVELAAGMPASLKVRGFTMKYLLKKVVQPWLPKEILTRKKRGFGAPMGSWIRRDLAVLVENLLSERQVKQRELFKWPFIREIIGQHGAQRADYTDQLLALINLELWCRIFLDGQDYREQGEIMSAA